MQNLRLLTGLTPLILIACHTSDSTAIDIKAAAAVAKVGGDPVKVVAGESFPDSIRVIVSDGASFPKYGVRVAFAVTAGGGSIAPAIVTTDAKGRAAAKFTTGMAIGTNTATATVAGLPVVSFTTTTVTAPPPIPFDFWSSASSGTTQHLNGIWGTSATDVWAVGDAGTILHYNGTSWSSVPSGTFQFLDGVWGSSASDVWAVGDNGTILHFNGTTWSSAAVGTTLNLLGSVWGSSAS